MMPMNFRKVTLTKQNLKFCTKTWQSTQKELEIIFSKKLCSQSTATTTANFNSSNESQTKTTDAQLEWERARPITEMPTAGGLKFIKEYFYGGKFYKKDTNEMLMLMREEYGDAYYLPGYLKKPPMVVCYDPKDFEKVFRNESIWPTRFGIETLKYHRMVYRADFFEGVEGLLATDGEKWGEFRSKVNQVLMQPKNVRLYYQKMAQVNKEFVERIKSLRDPQTNEVPENFESFINRWALESVSVVALDKQLGLLKGNQIDPSIQKLFDSVTEFVNLSPDLDAKPSIWQYVTTPKFKRVMKALDGVLDVTSHCVNEALERLEIEKKNGIEKPENEKGVLEKLLKIDRKVAIVMAMDMLMAGVDTTSSTFTAIMLCLAKNPEKQTKLREEIRRILPDKSSEFTEKSMNNMSYLRACIKEALRIYPLTLGNGRAVQRDVVLNGYRVPKGTHVTMVATHLSQDEKYYPYAHEFLPERWLRNNKETEKTECPNSLRTSNPFVYLPFGFGPRSCIGRRIAEMELELGVARIIRNFHVKFNYTTDKAFKVLLINVPNIALKFEFTDVEN